MKDIRSISFDTSFLLKRYPTIDKIIKQLERDGIQAFITSTVISELEQLKVWGRISEKDYKLAMARWRRINAKVIDIKNNLFNSVLNQECILSMGEHHGVVEKDIVNDCNIIITGLKNGVDFFLSEDFHFTSKVSEIVLEEISSNSCREYNQICGTELHAIDSLTFRSVYKNGKVDMEKLARMRKRVRKPGKTMKDY